MPSLQRHVRRLRLTAAHEDHARHGQVLLEDALRTATFGDEARLIVVRRLDLGRVSARAPATHWSRRLEESFHKTSPVPVSIHDQAAATAAAVYFLNHDEPWLQLTRRTLMNQPCNEWYWRSAAPDWKPGHSTADTLRLCVRTLATRGGLPLTLQLVNTLPFTVSPEPLFRCLEPADLVAVGADLGAPFSSAESTQPVSPDASPVAFPVLSETERHFFTSWGPADIRTHWLAAVRLSAASPNRFSVMRAAASPTARIQQLVQHWRQEAVSRHPFQRSSARTFSSPTHTSPANPKLPTTPPGQSLRPRPPTSPLEETAQPASEPIVVAERQFTHAGGLFFLLPLLSRAGLPTFLETLSPAKRADFPWHILRLALRHSRTAADDPLVSALHDLPACTHPLARWLILANRHALRLTSLNLRQLIQRPALVTLTPTHIDVFFRAREADLRLRRAALDLDPGWVVWLGRAVSYHFTRED